MNNGRATRELARRTLTAVGAAAVCAGAQAGQFDATLGVDLSRGGYGLEQRTSILALPIRLRWSEAPWSFAVSGSQLRLNTPARLIGDTPVGDGTERRRVSGIGDVYVAITRQFDPVGGVFIDATWRTKIPTADFDKGLGTGKFDHLVRVDAFWPLNDWLPFAALGYQFTGKRAGQRLRNAFRTSLGMARSWRRWQFAVSVDYREKTSAAGTDALELVPSANLRLSRQWTVGGYNVIGFTDGSPDIAIGVQLTWKPNAIR